MRHRHPPCPGCGVRLADVEGPTHRYLEASPACWATYGEVLAREFQDPAYMAVHRLTVDAYAVQHPGQPSPQTIQSVAVHLISLHVVLELGFAPKKATWLMARATESKKYRWLARPASLGHLTVVDVVGASSPGAHAEAVRLWAMDAYESWHEHHDQVEEWAGALM